MISKELEEFINVYINLIDENRFNALFEEARHLLSRNARSELLTLLYDSQIKFLDYMNFINANLYYCSPITSIVVPPNIKKIGNYAFTDSHLHSVYIEEGCEKIGMSAFARCKFLRDISFPSTLKELHIAVLSECYSLENIEFRGTINQWNTIQKDPSWFSTAGKFNLTVQCIDGSISVNN